MFKSITAFLSLFISITLAYSQPYYFKHYQVEDGLAYNSVICTMQDSRGFLWFGTKNGLNRFDGYSFKTFRNSSQIKKSIGSNFVLSLKEDENNNIWVGTTNGLYKYDPISEEFTLLKGTEENGVTDIAINAKGEMWFVSSFGLYKYTLDTKTLQSYNKKISQVTSIAITEDQSLWVSTGNGYLANYNEPDNSFETYNVFSHSTPTLSKWIPIIKAVGDGNILVGTKGQGLKIFNNKTFIYEDILTLNPDKTPIYVRDIMQYVDNEYWIATESGVFIYDLKLGLKQHLTKDRNDPFSLSDNAVYALNKDQEGGVWVGTYFGGVNYYTEKNSFFEKVFSRAEGNVLKNSAIREICQDQYGSIWIGTEDAGLVKYEPKVDKFTAFISDGKKGSISHNNIHGLLAVNDELWIGTFEQGLDVLSIETGKVIRNYKAGTGINQLKSNFIESLFITKNKAIFIATSTGLFRYNRQSDNFKRIEEIPEHHITSIVEDKEGTLWLGSTNNGIYSYNPEKGIIGNLTHDKSDPSSLISNLVNDLFIDSKNNLWVTTEDGLCIYDFKNEIFTPISSYHNFPSNVFYKVLEAPDHTLWVSTSKGLINIDPSFEKWKIFTKNNGLLNDQFNYKSGYIDPDGNLYFGSVIGLIKFNPSKKISNNYTPPVYFTGFQVSNIELEIKPSGSPLKESIVVTDRVVLKPSESTFSIDFAALSYTSPQMTEYAYRMKGIENDWVYLKTNRKVYFTDISPGKYIFEVKATTNSNWGEEVATLEVVILPPFWASNLAFFIYLLVIILIIYLIQRYNSKRLDEKNTRKFTLFENEKEREIYRAKVQFFTNITHEIRTPLTLIKGPLEMVIKQIEPETDISRSLLTMKNNTDRLIHLTDQLLNFRQTETDNFALSFVETDICALLKECYNRFLPLAKERKRSFEIETPSMGLTALTDEEAVRKIISNLFSNSIKYSKSQILIKLEAFEEENTFKITVKTDGKLIPQEIADKIFEPFFRPKESQNQSGTGIGLSLARSLAELHGGKLNLMAPEDNMNKFVLELPNHQEKSFKLFNESPKNTVDTQLNRQNQDDDKLLILIVEDDLELIEFIATVLVDKYRVIKAKDGKQALKVLKENPVNLIISDIMMPVMDGYEFCQQLKSDIEYSHIPIILLSAKNSIKSKIEGLEVGADSYIEKPFSPQHLLAQIDSLLSNREKIRSYFASSPLVHIKTMAYSPTDSKFLEKLNEVINENIDNTNLDVEQLAWLMNMSRPTLYRKIKALCDLSPLELITITRLKKAAELLVESDYKINKIAENLGFSSQTQFARNFVKQFNISPSKYRASKTEERVKN